MTAAVWRGLAGAPGMLRCAVGVEVSVIWEGVVEGASWWRVREEGKSGRVRGGVGEDGRKKKERRRRK